MMQKIDADEIVLDVSGAWAFATYDPECKRVICTDFQLKPGREQIPNKRMDLFLFLVGSSDTHFSITIDTIDQTEFLLTDGYLLLTKMVADQD
jgi:hypothetical protein